MEIKFEKKEVGEILKKYIQDTIKTEGKKIEVESKYNDYIVTVSDWPEDSETGGAE